MLTYFFTDKNGIRCKIKNVLTVEISADVDVPADELVLTVPYDRKYRNVDMLEAYDGKSLVFVGQADEIVSIVHNSGAIVRLSARSLAGRLLDNEAEPVTYINPAAKLELNRRLFTSLKKQHRKNFWIPYISLTKIQQWTEFWFSFRFQNRSTKKLCCVQSFRKRMWTASILSA